jgi:uncharacterized membrane protein YdjX (TVP38/TMEM64 family)
MFCLLIAGVVIYSAYDFDTVVDLFSSFVEWVQLSPLESSIAIVFIYIGLIVFTFPILYFTVSIGYAYSKAWSNATSPVHLILGDHTLANTLTAYLGALLLISCSVLVGGLITFLLSRYWLRRSIKRSLLRNHKSFLAVDSVLTQSGWKTIFLIRLTPLPFSIGSYLLGVTKVKVADFLIGSSTIVMHIALWLYIGKSLERFQDINAKIYS